MIPQYMPRNAPKLCPIIYFKIFSNFSKNIFKICPQMFLSFSTFSFNKKTFSKISLKFPCNFPKLLLNFLKIIPQKLSQNNFVHFLQSLLNSSKNFLFNFAKYEENFEKIFKILGKY